VRSQRSVSWSSTTLCAGRFWGRKEKKALNRNFITQMKQTRFILIFVLFILAVTLSEQRAATSSQHATAPRVVDLKTPDGTILKATYFTAAKPGPGVILFHQSNRTRESWDELAAQLAAIGIHVLTVDSRAHRESGGKYDNEANRAAYWKTWWPSDLDAAFQYLSSQSGVNREAIGGGGAGNLGVQSAIETARRHPGQVKSPVLLSGETVRLDWLSSYLSRDGGFTLWGFRFSHVERHTPAQGARLSLRHSNARYCRDRVLPLSSHRVFRCVSCRGHHQFFHVARCAHTRDHSTSEKLMALASL
jgi:dienelactone hydrolase